MEFLSTLIQDFEKLHAANVSAASITAPTPTATAPVDGVDGVIGALSGNDEAGNAAAIVFYGTRTSADNETFTARVTGWRKVGDLWIPIPLLALTLTQGTSVGVAGQAVGASEYFADTITASSAYTSAYELVGPADNGVACVKVDFFGCRKLQVQLAKGTNASCNALAGVF